ncbi:hypothetical protein C8F01DRAFT_1232010 [Mycena amicta]|nr:hypothetical protein C8F01DRAFT_1232010 [Mycena amicta]
MAPHPLLRSSRHRPLLQDQDLGHVNASTPHIPFTHPSTQPRERTSSSETIRPRVKAKLSVAALLKPKPSLAVDAVTLSIMKRSGTRKRTHSATSPEPDEDDSDSLRTHPRTRQRTDSSSTRSERPALRTINKPDRDETITIRTGMTTLKKLKEKLSPTQAPAQLALVSAHRQTQRPIVSSSPPRTRSPTENVSELFAFPISSDAETSPSLHTTTPLQSLSLNTDPVSLSAFSRKPLRVIPGARINKFGCYEPDISEFELAITVPSGSGADFEVWDQDDEFLFVGPLSLHLTLKNPVKWAGLPLSHPDVSVLEMTCTSKPVLSAVRSNGSISAPRSTVAFTSRYEGARTHQTATPPDPKRGITIDPVWLRTYPDTDPLTGRLVGRRGWAMNFSVPLATRLFEKCDTRAFELAASILVWGELIEVAGAGMCVSHLKRESVMVGRTGEM